jgi:PIN domain nuclease of toxin-antitoxin system
MVDPLLAEASISAVNWSEVLQKVAQRGRDAGEAGDLLRALGLEVVPLTAEDAASAARLWSQASSLSLGDRCCLALARRLGVPAITADRDWEGSAAGVEIQTIR